MQKLFIAGIAIFLFAFVVVFYTNQGQESQDVADYTVHTKISTKGDIQEVQRQMFDGDVYDCDNGSVLYIDVREGNAHLTLVYPDDLYGIAVMEENNSQGSAKKYVGPDDENTLTISNGSAEFIINETPVADKCLLRS